MPIEDDIIDSAKYLYLAFISIHKIKKDMSKGKKLFYNTIVSHSKKDRIDFFFLY